MHATHEEVLVPVVVEVAYGHARVVARSRQARFVGGVGEVAFAVIQEQAVAILRIGFPERANVRSVSEEDVEMAVVISVEDRHSTGHGFGRMPLGRLAAVQREVDRLVSEPNRAACIRLSDSQPDGGAGQGCRHEETRRGMKSHLNDYRTECWFAPFAPAVKCRRASSG